MDEATQRKRIRHIVETISYRIDMAKKRNDPKLFYVYNGEFMLDVVIILQRMYRNTAVVSRTPEGIVAHFMSWHSSNGRLED